MKAGGEFGDMEMYFYLSIILNNNAITLTMSAKLQHNCMGEWYTYFVRDQSNVDNAVIT